MDSCGNDAASAMICLLPAMLGEPASWR